MIKIIQISILLFKKFGFRFLYLIIPIYRLFYSILYFIGSFIDALFFRNYKKIEIEKPVFLVGHPRSGTTFIHKFFIKNCNEFEGMYLWRMIFPTLISRFIIKPILPFINKFFPKNLYDPNIHKTGFLEPETDDAALFFKSFDGMFSWLYFSALNNYENFNELENDLIKTSKLNPVLLNLKTLYKKNLYKSTRSKRIFSKSFSLILNLREVKNVFPDAKLIILIRDPLEVIPSSLSLARNVQMNLNKFDKLSLIEKNEYYRNLYSASILFYKKLINQINDNLIRREDYILINYKDLLTDFEEKMDVLIHFCEINKTQELAHAIKQQSAKQTTYKGRHEYSLEEFGFTKEEVLKDFDFVYSHFNI